MLHALRAIMFFPSTAYNLILNEMKLLEQLRKPLYAVTTMHSLRETHHVYRRRSVWK